MAKGARAPLELLYFTTRGRNALHARPPNHIERQTGASHTENAMVVARLEAGDNARMERRGPQFATFATHPDLAA